MAVAGTMRVPLFFEVDLETDPAREGDTAVVRIHATGGRIVSEDGTILGEIRFGAEAERAPAERTRDPNTT